MAEWRAGTQCHQYGRLGQKLELEVHEVERCERGRRKGRGPSLQTEPNDTRDSPRALWKERGRRRGRVGPGWNQTQLASGNGFARNAPLEASDGFDQHACERHGKSIADPREGEVNRQHSLKRLADNTIWNTLDVRPR